MNESKVERYHKLKKRGACPAWHKSAGIPGWLFADEV